MQGYDQLGVVGANKLLARARRAVLATLTPSGAPHLVPIVYAGDVQQLWFAVDGKPKRHTRLARLAHIERDPRVALLIDRYAADWSQLFWLRLEGAARVVNRTEPAAQAALVRLLARYPQYAQTSPGASADALVCIDVTRVVAWCADHWDVLLGDDQAGAAD